jgi:Trypsin-like peptidase domain
MHKNIYVSLTIIYFSCQFLSGCMNNFVEKQQSQQTTVINKEEKSSLEKDIKSKALQFTVKIITKNGTYTGVITSNKDNTYNVLSTNHTFNPTQTTTMEVIGADAADKEVQKKINPEQMEVITFDEVHHPILNESIKPLKDDLDLAVFQFESKSTKKYSSAKFSRNIDSNQYIYSFGYKNCDNKSTVGDTQEFNFGKVITDNSYKNKPKTGGYQLFYTNPSIQGMSGSPILDKDGNVIAIHGYADTDKSTYQSKPLELCDPLANYGYDFNGNWGIKTDTFIDLLQKMAGV